MLSPCFQGSLFIAKVRTNKTLIDKNKMHSQILLVLLVPNDTKIQYHLGQIADFGSASQIPSKIGWLVRLGMMQSKDTS